jgi:phosphate starvation-inducible PhoH-like protein
MGKASRAQRREGNSSFSGKSRNSRRNAALDGTDSNVYQMHPEAKFTAKELTPKNAEQKAYINTIKNSTITIATGKPGSGKTFIPSVLAAQEIMRTKSDIESIILVRPNEPLGKSLGMLPGTMAEKMEPWLEPIADGIRWAIGDQAYKGLVEREKIKPLPIEFARGRTFNNAFVIVDEAQNISVEAMICLLMRLGMDSKLVICGDIAQKDIAGNSGLAMLMNIYEKYDYAPYRLVELMENVRSKESAAMYEIFVQEGLI